MGYITSIGTATPPNKFSQNQIAKFMIMAMGLTGSEADRLKTLYRASGIHTRHSVLEDYGMTGKFTFYPDSENLEPFPTTKDRLGLFRKYAAKLGTAAAQDCLHRVPGFNSLEPTHLIVVSCTGMFAPGLDVELVHSLQLRPAIQRTVINFMGCHAAFNAIRVAESFCCQNANAKVLVVCAELCSLHFQKESTEDNKLANALFADGAAALLIEPAARGNINMQIGHSFCGLAGDSMDNMAWNIGNHGFEMKLSAYVPDIIKSGIKELANSLLAINQIKLSDISYFAIHPGGKKILEAIEGELGLSRNDNRFAYSVMRQYGNMSSPTVIFVLQALLATLSEGDHGKKVLSFGFGPGLTLEGLILTVDCR
ncbi:MAG: type III polyketide synthase [Cyclobacteriaceae bacterium]|nr:type III polyketide synthase [Cyclobacteriaceae bacterium]MCB0498753.1 type III polyketide synthase [Cyclobacteriaceae bacterium]MCB9237735.1 type III polyketide synthase [Flammeovirgaceae bacterium]MCW5903096.1 type III polyketide synthase [Cyclobacteriaceae bacterium]